MVGRWVGWFSMVLGEPNLFVPLSQLGPLKDLGFPCDLTALSRLCRNEHQPFLGALMLRIPLGRLFLGLLNAHTSLRASRVALAFKPRAQKEHVGVHFFSPPQKSGFLFWVSLKATKRKSGFIFWFSFKTTKRGTLKKTFPFLGFLENHKKTRPYEQEPG